MEMEKTVIYRNGINRDEAYTKLLNLLGPNNDVMLWNDNDGQAARLSKRSVDKIMSNSASNKSMHNGFTRKQHYAAASDIDKLFKEAVRVWSHPDKSGAANVLIHRYAAPIHVKDALAYITVKESTQHGKRVYSAELMKIEKLAGILEEAEEKSPPLHPSPNFENKTKKPVGMLEEAKEASHTLPHHGPDTDDGGHLAGAGNPPREPPAPRLYTDNIRQLLEKVNTQSEKY